MTGDVLLCPRQRNEAVAEGDSGHERILVFKMGTIIVYSYVDGSQELERLKFVIR